MGYEFTKKYAIETYDFDRYGKVKITSLMNALQDISTAHFNQVTQGRIENSSGIWVIVEWDFNVIAPPEKPCEIMVTTEPIYFRKFIAYRRYTIRDLSDRVLGTAISKWAYIDLELRRNTSIPKIFNALFGVEELAEKPKKIGIDPENLQKVSTNTFMSYDSDLDVNHHVNNVVYVRWAMDALNLSKKLKTSSNEAKRIKVIYKKETFEGDRINVDSYLDGDEKRTVHLLNNSLGERCVEVEFEFIN